MKEINYKGFIIYIRSSTYKEGSKKYYHASLYSNKQEEGSFSIEKDTAAKAISKLQESIDKFLKEVELANTYEKKVELIRNCYVYYMYNEPTINLQLFKHIFPNEQES